MNSLETAGKHAIRYDRPAAIVVHFGHNNVWDIRIAEDHKEEIGTFGELFARLKAIPADYAHLSDDPWYRKYVKMAGENYEKPYPRPMPCGSLLLGFDPRTTEVLGHRLHLDSGLCDVYLLVDGSRVTLQLFVEQQADRLWASVKEPEDGSRALAGPAFMNRIKLIPDPETPPELPRYAVSTDRERRRLAFRQTLPFSLSEDGTAAGHPRDRAFRLSVEVQSAETFAETGAELEASVRCASGFLLCVSLEEGPDSFVPAAADIPSDRPDESAFARALAGSLDGWREYWSRSGVALEDEELERLWYRNLYFYNCSVKPDATCPGLFANWSYGKIGSEWHGDYHMNYNTQQPFWVAFSSNHAEKHLAYASMVEQVLPLSRRWARDYYGLRGAYFPHSAYPVEMSMMPYPVPHWGWEVCETPWTVQSLWWHYLYTMDREFLADRAFVPMKEAVLFMVDYMKRPEASGEGWSDDRYHIYPTVVPELYELTPGFKLNRDCIVDLTLTKFLFRAFGSACEALGREEQEAELLAEVRDVLSRFPDYPTAESRRGTVFVSVSGEDPEVVYNVPNSVTTVFPGEDHGLHSDPETYAIAVNSYRNHRNEGGNDIVFCALAGARLGQLDLERFKRQVNYCMLPNGTCTDKLLLSGGRYSDTTPFDYMSSMGVWFENFALPAVVNECLLQSYNGILRLFPNWPSGKRAEFKTLRAVGAFLVSALWEDGEVQWAEIRSEAGSELKLYSPWTAGEVIVRPTRPGETIRLTKDRQGG
ncbi:glycosyl hydrolase family 95 catalytic domain-containing protein [Cohnella thermotolerans]|uniref:glycosyl hydrolase family 95 catalytic domain-containing protein n=1 Tax=Cohnella thermotolerans TaxID=329858 RepID=UPI000404B989|nr:hypothetical protein [Cohnella thermotolerans]